MRQRAVLEPLGQRLALEKLHDEIGMALVLADVVQRTDVRMFEPRDVPRLALEPLAPLRIGGEARRQHLDGHRAVEPRVLRLEHLAHPALADEGDDFIRAEPRAGREHMGIGRENPPGGLMFRQWGRAYFQKLRPSSL